MSAYLATAIPTEIGPGNTGNNDFGASSLLTNSIVCLIPSTLTLYRLHLERFPQTRLNDPQSRTLNLYIARCRIPRARRIDPIYSCATLCTFVQTHHGFDCVGISLPLDISNDFLSLIFVNSFTFSAFSPFLTMCECFSTSKSPSSPSAFQLERLL